MEYNILICDDDRDIVEALRIYLSAEGYHIFAAYTGGGYGNHPSGKPSIWY